MKNNYVLENVLKSFESYYDIKKDNITKPFAAEAVFHSHSEQYFMVKAAKLAEVDSNEYVFFSSIDNLDFEQLNALAEKAWNEGLSRVHPHSSHRNSDVTLVVLADKINDDAFNRVKKLKYYKSYKFSFYGWSNFRVIVQEISSGRLGYNRLGKDLKKIFCNINKSR